MLFVREPKPTLEQVWAHYKKQAPHSGGQQTHGRSYRSAAAMIGDSKVIMKRAGRHNLNVILNFYDSSFCDGERSADEAIYTWFNRDEFSPAAAHVDRCLLAFTCARMVEICFVLLTDTSFGNL